MATELRETPSEAALQDIAATALAITPKERFLRACRSLPVDRPPVWLMRQAGRYLPSYRAVRHRVDFLTLCRTPELAAEVAVSAVRDLGVDAAILFSDILIPVAAMGPMVRFDDGGPRVDPPVRTAADVKRLALFDPLDATPFVYDALRLTAKGLGRAHPVIGFSGGPFTVASYLV
jgi:uroporphyrinogen decarboxylase